MSRWEKVIKNGIGLVLVFALLYLAYDVGVMEGWQALLLATSIVMFLNAIYLERVAHVDEDRDT